MRPSLPGLSQFDHMIVAVRDADTEGGWCWIDPTQGAWTGDEAPGGLGGKFALIVGPEGGIDARIPGGGDRDGLSTIHRELALGENGTVTCTETVTYSEFHSAAILPVVRAFQDEPEKLDQILTGTCFGTPPVGVELEGVEKVDGAAGRLTVRIRYRASGALTRVSGQVVARLPLQVESMLLMPPDDLGGRRQDIQTPADLAVETTTVTRAPSGGTLPAVRVEQNGGTRFETRTMSVSGGAHVQRFELSAERFTKDELGDFRRAVGTSLAAAQAQFVFGASASTTPALAGEIEEP